MRSVFQRLPTDAKVVLLINRTMDKYENLIGFINLLAHSALTEDQHKILDEILEYSGETQESLASIANRYNVENLNFE